MATGAKATMTFVGSGWTGRFRVIGGFRRFRAIVEDTGLGDAQEKACPGYVIRHDPIEVQLYWDQDNPPPIESAAEDIIFKFPPRTGQTNGAKITGKGFISESTTPEMDNETEMVGTFSLKFSDALALTDGS